MIKRLAKDLITSKKSIQAIEFLEKKIPFLQQWHRFAYVQHFERVSKWERIFHGIYPDIATAVQHIPKHRPVGYDNAETAAFLGRGGTIYPSDYPILFWLALLFRENSIIFDLGGYLAISYSSYNKYAIYPSGLQWIVDDVPAVVAEGDRMLKERPNSSLRFTSSFAEAASADILLAAGSLQFMEEPFANMLRRLKAMPNHLLINKTPLTDAKQFVTLQNMGPAISTYAVANRGDFIESILALGFELIDTWKNPDFGCYIPFHPDESIKEFDGFYFRKSPCPQGA